MDISVKTWTVWSDARSVFHMIYEHGYSHVPVGDKWRSDRYGHDGHRRGKHKQRLGAKEVTILVSPYERKKCLVRRRAGYSDA